MYVFIYLARPFEPSPKRRTPSFLPSKKERKKMEEAPQVAIVSLLIFCTITTTLSNLQLNSCAVLGANLRNTLLLNTPATPPPPIGPDLDFAATCTSPAYRDVMEPPHNLILTTQICNESSSITYVVDPSGGEYTTIQSAIDAVPDHNLDRTTIYIVAGSYW